MARFPGILACLALAVLGATGALWPSCGECEASVLKAQQEWSQVAPALLSELPSALCRDCSVPELCGSVVVAALRLVNMTVLELSAADVCAELELCNITAPILI